MDLIFVTSFFPYGFGETFIENEIRFLASSFDHIYIYSCNFAYETGHRPCPDNVIVCEERVHNWAKYIPLFNRALLRECLTFLGTRGFLGKCSSTFYLAKETWRASRRINAFLDKLHLQPGSKIVVYSYWLSHIGMTAINLSEALKKRGIDAKIVARCHGFDLYEERAYRHYLPFQKYMLSRFDRIYPCSKQGTRYLQEKYPEFSDKISCSYLGIDDHFTGRLPQQQPFSIVSCSNVIPVKRVKRIAEALKEIKDIPLTWTHFGDGELSEDLNTYVKNELASNIAVSLPGRVSNTEIYRYYQEHNVSLFINVSSSEGLPVSIMEACSFGIPIIATDVGGTNEIVHNGENGFLLKASFENKDLVRAIQHIAGLKKQEYEKFCLASRKQFEISFSSGKNYPKFCEQIVDAQGEKMDES